MKKKDAITLFATGNWVKIFFSGKFAHVFGNWQKYWRLLCIYNLMMNNAWAHKVNAKHINRNRCRNRKPKTKACAQTIPRVYISVSFARSLARCPLISRYNWLNMKNMIHYFVFNLSPNREKAQIHTNTFAYFNSCRPTEQFSFRNWVSCKLFFSLFSPLQFVSIFPSLDVQRWDLMRYSLAYQQVFR